MKKIKLLEQATILLDRGAIVLAVSEAGDGHWNLDISQCMENCKLRIGIKVEGGTYYKFWDDIKRVNQ